MTARSPMFARPRGAATAALLPPGARAFFHRRLLEIGGATAVAVGGAMAFALATYDVGDSSFNTAAGAATANGLGGTGAWLADGLLQWLGVGALMPVLCLLAWGLRLLGHRPFDRALWRVATLLPAAALLTAAAAALVPPAGWPLRSGLGGVIGDLLWPLAAPLAPSAEVDPDLLIAAIAVVGSGFLLFALAIRPVEWFAGARHAGAALRLAGRGAGRLTQIAATLSLQMAAIIGHALARRREGRIEPYFEPPLAGFDDAPAAAARPTPPDAPPAPAAKRVRRTRAARPSAANRQMSLDLPQPSGEYTLPALDLLTPPPHADGLDAAHDDALEGNARLLESVLDDFGVRGEIVKVRPGPVVTLYELAPAPGTKTSRVIGLADDIARSMSAVSVRIAVVPGHNVIGIELPNARREVVFLRELLAARAFERHGGTLTLALGKDISGAPVTVDLARMPHLLIAGTTGSGKSVGINAVIASLLYRLRPEDCRFIMIDPKMLELSVYDGIPHLLAPVVTDPKRAVVALKWVVREMENRYRAMSKLGVRNIAGYNQRLEVARKKGEVLTRRVQTGFDAETGKPVFEDEPLDTERLPLIVVVVDEMADLMLVAGKDVEVAIQRLAQMARAAGIHIVMATQRPSVDVITGTIKANFPTRISFQVTSKVDSRTILGEQGAEQLLGQGDMLYMAGGGRITRVHGPFVSDDEVEELVAYLKGQGVPEYIDAVTEDDDIAIGIPGFEVEAPSGDELYDQAVALVAREGKASTSFVQRHLQIGYNRAARIIERMEKEGVVGAANHVGKREVLVGDHSL